MPRFFDDKELFLSELENSDFVLAEMARRLGVSRTTINRSVKRFGIEVVGLRQEFLKKKRLDVLEKEVYDEPKKEAEPAEIVQLKSKISRLAAQNKSLRAQNDLLFKENDIVGQCRDLLAPIIESNVFVAPKPLGKLPKSSGEPKTMIWHLTDLHWGEIVIAKSINRANAYSPNIAANRLEHTVEVIRKVVRDNASGYDELIIALNGDTIGGAIHPESTIYYASAIRQALDVALVLAQVVADCRQIFRIVRILVTTGNHPRTSRRTPTGGPARIETSYELVVAEYLAALLANDKNVTFELADGYTLLTEICGETWAFSHGDGTGGGGGQLSIPAYGLKRAHDANREWSIVVAELENKTINSVVKHSRYGHFHTYFFWVAGSADIGLMPSPKGVDSYVKDKLGRYSPPMFVLETIDKKNGKITMHEVDLREIMTESECRYVWNTEGGMTVDYYQPKRGR